MSVVEDRGLDDHTPGEKGADGHFRCEACGYRWPCPEVRSRPRPLDADERELLRSLDVGVGFTLWRRQPDGSELDPVGGTVVGSYDSDGLTVFRLRDFDRGRPRVRELALGDVEPATVGLPNAAYVRSLVRNLAAWVGKQKGMVTGQELEVLSDAIVLLRSFPS